MSPVPTAAPTDVAIAAPTKTPVSAPEPPIEVTPLAPTVEPSPVPATAAGAPVGSGALSKAAAARVTDPNHPDHPDHHRLRDLSVAMEGILADVGGALSRAYSNTYSNMGAGLDAEARDKDMQSNTAHMAELELERTRSLERSMSRTLDRSTSRRSVHFPPNAPPDGTTAANANAAVLAADGAAVATGDSLKDPAAAEGGAAAAEPHPKELADRIHHWAEELKALLHRMPHPHILHDHDDCEVKGARTPRSGARTPRSGAMTPRSRSKTPENEHPTAPDARIYAINYAIPL